MKGFIMTTASGEAIKFYFYLSEAPETCRAFAAALPFTRVFMQARVSGQEFWIDDAPSLDIIQENASVFAEPGEVVIGPLKPSRAKTAKCMGIYYGEGRGLDACNIFARVAEEDMAHLKELGNRIWKEGAQSINFKLLS